MNSFRSNQVLLSAALFRYSPIPVFVLFALDCYVADIKDNMNKRQHCWAVGQQNWAGIESGDITRLSDACTAASTINTATTAAAAAAAAAAAICDVLCVKKCPLANTDNCPLWRSFLNCSLLLSKNNLFLSGCTTDSRTCFWLDVHVRTVGSDVKHLFETVFSCQLEGLLRHYAGKVDVLNYIISVTETEGNFKVVFHYVSDKKPQLGCNRCRKKFKSLPSA
jgi:hypothetical protein